MIKLAWAELKDGWKAWTGVCCVIFVTSTVMGACATIMSTWIALRATPRASESLTDVFSQLSVMVPAFSGFVAIVVLSSVASSAVQTDRIRYARWQLVGITPGQVKGVLAIQLAVLAMIFGVAGEVLAMALSQPTVSYVERAVTAATGETYTTAAALNPLVFGLALLVNLTIVLLSGLAPARRAARVSVLDALRVPEPAIRTMTFSRWILATLCGLATIGLMASAFGSQREVISLNTIFACITSAATIAALTPLVLPLLVWIWPRVVPDRFSIIWTVARQSALHRIHTSAASVTPLMVGITLIGAIFSAAYTERNALLMNSVPVQRMNLATDQITIMLAGPLLLAVVGSAAVVFQSASDRSDSARVLLQIGFKISDVLWAAVAEALIYICTALIASLLIIACLVSTESLALAGALGSAWPTITIGPIAVVTIAGALVIIPAIILPLLPRKSHNGFDTFRG